LRRAFRRFSAAVSERLGDGVDALKSNGASRLAIQWSKSLPLLAAGRNPYPVREWYHLGDVNAADFKPTGLALAPQQDHALALLFGKNRKCEVPVPQGFLQTTLEPVLVGGHLAFACLRRFGVNYWPATRFARGRNTYAGRPGFDGESQAALRGCECRRPLRCAVGYGRLPSSGRPAHTESRWPKRRKARGSWRNWDPQLITQSIGPEAFCFPQSNVLRPFLAPLRRGNRSNSNSQLGKSNYRWQFGQWDPFN
jgi:hypothetical protein